MVESEKFLFLVIDNTNYELKKGSFLREKPENLKLGENPEKPTVAL